MRIATQVGYAGDVKQAIDRLPELERAGCDMVWVAEAYALDAPSAMGYIAAITERMEIGAGIMPLYSRTPTLIAMTAAGVDHLSGGRCVLGLGASGPQVIEGWHGVPYDRPLGRTREIIEVCRQVWRRERVEHSGRSYTIPLPPEQGTGLGKPLKLISHPVRDRIPIYVASLGARNVEMTAELADGWLPILFIPEKADEVWGEPLAKGLAGRAPDLGPLEISAGGMVAIGEGLEPMRDFARPYVALYVGGMGARERNFYNELARRYGYEKEAAVVQDLYLAGRKEEAAAALPAELIERTTLVGPPGYIKDRLAAYKEAGVTVLTTTIVSDDPVRTMGQLRELADSV